MSGLMGDICNTCGQSDWSGHKCELKYDKDKCIDLLIESGNILMHDLIGSKDDLIKLDVKRWIELTKKVKGN